MIEVVVIAILSILLGWKEYSSRKEREKLINALIAKNAKELQELEFVEKLKPVRAEPEPEIPDDLVPIDEMEAESKDFEKVIKGGTEE